VIVIDDGLATGSTMEAAVKALREHSPAKIIVASPVGAADSCRRVRAVADEAICLQTPELFNAVGQWYQVFDQTTDAEVVELLRRADDRSASPPRAPVTSDAGQGILGRIR
jgi:putative phosphoribosyl transferase